MTITFDATQFKIDYPEFIDISDAKLTNTFTYSASIMGQSISACFCEDDVQYYYLCLVLAHIMYIQQNGLTGRVSSATQGSESISTEFTTPAGLQYWGLSPYGLEIMQIMIMLLSGPHYVPSGMPAYNGAGITPYYDYGFTGSDYGPY